MFIYKTLNSGIRVAIVVRRTTEERLWTKCFRGTALPLAGNFLRWCSADQLFSDCEVVEHFLTELDELWSKQEFGTSSVSIVHSMPVGWESTGALQNYANDDLEEFHLNRRSWGLRVKPGRTDLLVPKTNELTLVFELKSEGGEAVAVVHSIYPGKDVGELDSNVTDREKRVFFDWEHPGAV
ncbi:MAG: hypothetical protein V4681_02100 [Patescibacteria group bacterium]